MIFVDQRFEELALKNAGFSKSNYTFLDIYSDCSASAVISRIKIPPSNETLFKKHVEDGSVFVAFMDKVSRDKNAISKLIELGVKNIVAVYLGTAIHVHGKVIIGDLEFTEKDFIEDKCFLASVGVQVFDMPIDYLDLLLDEIEKYRTSTDSIGIYPSYVKYHIDDDWRAMVAGMPLIDYEKANALYNKYGDVDVIDVLRDLTNPEKNQSGFGKIVCERLRDWIGIPQGFNIGLVWEDDE